MADSNNTLEILIKLGYIGADRAAAARQDLEGLKEVTGDLSQSVPEGSAAWAKYKNVLDEAGGATLGMREKAELLRLGLNNLGAGFGELGILARLFFNPATAGFAAAAFGLHEIFAEIDKVNTRQREMIDLAGRSSKVLHEIIAARPNAEHDWEAWLSTMDAIEQKLHGIGQALEADARIARNFQEVTRGIEQNKITEAGTFGLGAKSEAEQNAFGTQISVARNSLSQAQRNLFGLGDEGKAVSGQQAARERVDELKRQIDNLPKAIADEQTFVDTINRNFHSASITDIRNRDASEEQIQRFNEWLQKAKDQLPDAEKALAAANEQVAAFDKARAAVQQLTDQIVDLQNQLGILNDRIRREAPEINTDTARRELSSARSIADRVTGGGSAGNDEAQYLIRIANTLSGHSNNLQQAVELIESTNPAELQSRLLRVVENQNASMRDLFQRVQQVESQLSNHGP